MTVIGNPEYREGQCDLPLALRSIGDTIREHKKLQNCNSRGGRTMHCRRAQVRLPRNRLLLCRRRRRSGHRVDTRIHTLDRFGFQRRRRGRIDTRLHTRTVNEQWPDLSLTRRLRALPLPYFQLRHIVGLEAEMIGHLLPFVIAAARVDRGVPAFRRHAPADGIEHLVEDLGQIMDGEGLPFPPALVHLREARTLR